MNAKEMTPVLVLAALIGGAAGAAAALSLAPKEKADASPSPDTAARLKSAEQDLAAAKAEIEATRKQLVELRERTASAEMSIAKNAAAVAAAEKKPGGRMIRVGRGAAGAGEKSDGGKSEATAPQTIELGDGAMSIALDGLGEQLGQLNGDLASLGAGVELRKLPEDQRWQKAKDDLGLTWNQVEDLKKAVADRDAAMKDAKTTETKPGTDGGTITVTRSDPAKAAHAQADYQDRVNAALSDEQKRNWRSKGYDNAFGSGGFGQTMVMSVNLTNDKSGGPAKDK